MCRYATIELVSTDCGQARLGQPVHQYTKWIYWLCRDARHDKPCENKTLKDGHAWSDVGSRQGPCPVCDATAQAEENYKIAYSRAMAQFEDATRRAWDKKQRELGEAKYITESVSLAPPHHTVQLLMIGIQYPYRSRPSSRYY
jgi:hypothetical protein